MHAIPYRWPRPDPIVMDIGAREVAAEQPYIHRICRLGAAAERAGRGFGFVRRAAHVIWSGEVDNWHEGDHLARALAESGLDADAVARESHEDALGLDAEIARNEADQRAAGHWGVPLFLFEGEPFFGQDRLDLLVWRMRQAGLQERRNP
jgi:2-hydroxychromene-2-carboxylate isomerase